MSAFDATGMQRPHVTPSMNNGGFTSVQTAALGTDWTAFPERRCRQITIKNTTGVALEVRQGGGGTAWPLEVGAQETFFGLQNAYQMSVRRADTSNTQVTVLARWED